MKRLLSALLVLTLFILPACAQEIYTEPLVPRIVPPAANGGEAALYCGPTQGFLRIGNAALDLGAPYVVFGQYDCWAMAAQGTPDAFGPVGWIEAAHLAGADVPELPFSDAYEAMIEEDAAATDDPLGLVPGRESAITLPRGTWVVVLAAFGDMLYVQCETGGVPARVFVPAACIL